MCLTRWVLPFGGGPVPPFSSHRLVGGREAIPAGSVMLRHAPSTVAIGLAGSFVPL